MNEEDVQKQLKHMMTFIEQEANEKAEEIDRKAEEEFNIEKGRLVQQQRTKIMEFYEKKEKQVELQRKIQSSNMLNQARLKALKYREDCIKHVLDEARAKLAQVAQDPSRYQSILHGLVLQGLFQLLESDVTLRCKQCDLQLVNAVLPQCQEAYKQKTGSECRVNVDQQNSLSAQTAGGVMLLSRDGKISVDSTLEARLELISNRMVPHIRTVLFGPNQNRKFFD